MKKICLITNNELFMEDFSSQLKLRLKDIEISSNIEEADIDLYLIDENEDILCSLEEKNNTTPVVLFSSHKETSIYADIVIKKPFSLLNFITSFEQNTLLPKVRRKDCIP